MNENERQAILDRVAAFPYWYHRIELPHGVVTPGWAPRVPEAYAIPDDLSGKRVLDIGAWDGYWSFEALRRGAREVVAIDDFSDFLGALEDTDRRAWQTFDLCRELLGYDEARCSRREMSVYDLSEEEVGHFDVVFFFGTLYHLRYPQLALDKIGRICDGSLFVESAVLDDYSPYRGGLHEGYSGGQMVMEFYPGRQYGENASNWWVPTLHCLLHMVACAGFTEAGKGWKLTDTPTEVAHCRGFVSASKPGEPAAGRSD